MTTSHAGRWGGGGEDIGPRCGWVGVTRKVLLEQWAVACHTNHRAPNGSLRLDVAACSLIWVQEVSTWYSKKADASLWWSGSRY